MILEMSYDDDKLVNEILENYPDLLLEAHNENTTKGKKESYMFKSHWAARQNPFAILFEDMDKNKVIHAFYSEAGECTFENINEYLMTHE